MLLTDPSYGQSFTSNRVPGRKLKPTRNDGVRQSVRLYRQVPFYLAQEPDSPSSGGGSRFGTNWCDQSYVSGNLQQDVANHEIKHVEVYHDARVRELSDVIRRLESTTDTVSQAMYDSYDKEYERAESIARGETRRIVDAKNGPFTLRPRDRQGPCVLRDELGGELENREG
jgi:hypothetical protein